MKKGLLKGMAFMLAAAMLLPGCGSGDKKTEGGNTSANQKTADPVELKVYMFGEFRKTDEVFAEFEKRTKDTLNTKIKLTTIPAADYKDRLTVMHASSEEMDLVWDAPSRLLTTLAPQGGYQELDKYFFNDEYPGLKKCFSKEYIEGNKFFGHVYGVPLTQAYTDMEGFIVRKDLREKYGMGPLKNIDDLKKYLDTVMEKEKGLIPFAARNNRGFYVMFSDGKEKALANIINVGGMGGVSFDVAISKDNKKVLGVTTNYAYAAGGDSDEYYKDFPEGFNKPNYDKVLTNRDWNKYLEKDVLLQKDAYAVFNAGKAAATEGGLANVTDINAKIAKAVPGASIEFVPYYKGDYEMKPGARVTDYKAWNFVAVPSTSKKIDRTMKFLDWVFADQANHDLFEFGIEGKNWTAVGNDQYKIPDGVEESTNYFFPGYEMTWNSNYIRMPAGWADSVKSYYKYQLRNDTFKRSPLTGFTLDITPIKNDIAKVTPIYNENLNAIICGVLPDPVAAIKDFNKKATAAGLNKMRDEVKKQVQGFLDNQK